MRIKLTLTANAGVILNYGEEGPVYGIDALHDTKGLEFSCLSEEQVANTFALLDKKPPDALLTTHKHPDHYSEPLLEKAGERYPDCHIIKPWSVPDNKCKMYIKNGDTLAAIPLPHRFAPHYPDADNYGFVINVGDKTVFTAGDAEPTTEEMQSFARDFHPDIAILPFLWVTLSKCRRILDRLAPKYLVLVHLPFEEEDSCGYNHAALAETKRFYPEAVVLNKHMQSVEFDI